MVIGSIKINPKTKNHKTIIEAVSNKLGGYRLQEIDDMLIVTADGTFVEDVTISAPDAAQITELVKSTILEKVIKPRSLLTYTTQFTIKVGDKIVSKINGLAACALLGQLSAFIVKAHK